jgi:hypothetical protein
MSRFGKIAVSALLLVPVGLGGCKPQKGTANPEDYFPLIQVALAGGETAAMIGRNEAIKAENFPGCVASEALITAFDGGGQVLAGRLDDKIVIPAVDIDVSECLALKDSPAAEEPAAEEPAAEELAAEELAAEEAAAEEPAAEAGSPDAAVLVETIAGITIAAVLHYANKLKTVNCKKGTAAIGAVDYVAGMVTPVAEEIADPDGKMSIPAVTIDLSECAD